MQTTEWTSFGLDKLNQTIRNSVHGQLCVCMYIEYQWKPAVSSSLINFFILKGSLKQLKKKVRFKGKLFYTLLHFCCNLVCSL